MWSARTYPCEWGCVGSPGSRTPSQRKVENLAAAVSLHYMYYNFARPHQTLTKQANGYKMTPAMAAGIERRIWTHTDIAALLD